MVPAPRPGLIEEYEQYVAACAEYNRLSLQLQGEPENCDPERLAEANFAPRCKHVRTSGLRCLAPALRGRTLCYAHTRMAAGKKAGLQLPPLEDASSIALAAMQIVQQLLDGKVERKTAAIALYGVQIVASTLNHKPFAAMPTSLVLEDAGLPPEEELLGDNVNNAQSAPEAGSAIAEKPVEKPSEKTSRNGKSSGAELRPDISEETSRNGSAVWSIPMLGSDDACDTSEMSHLRSAPH